MWKQLKVSESKRIVFVMCYVCSVSEEGEYVPPKAEVVETEEPGATFSSKWASKVVFYSM